MERRSDELLAEIEKTDDRATYVVLADALVEAGDPRGELMHVQLALDDGPVDDGELPPHLRALPRPDPLDRDEKLDRAKVKELRGRRRELQQPRIRALLGPLAESKDVELEFRYGLLDRVKLRASSALPMGPGIPGGTTVASVLSRILLSPEARMLRTIELRPAYRPESGSVGQLLRWLAKADVTMPTALRSLQLGYEAGTHEYKEISFEGEAYEDDLAAVLDAFPALHELWIDLGTATLELAPLVSQHLRHVTFASAHTRPETFAALAQSALPELRSFVVWTGGTYYVNWRSDLDDDPNPDCRGPQLASLEPVFAMLDGCAELRHVGVCNHAGDLAALVEAMGAHPFAARLTTLDLSFADRVDSERLAPHLARFPALTHLVILGVRVSPQRVLQSATRQLVGGELLWDDQKRYRYVVTQE